MDSHALNGRHGVDASRFLAPEGNRRFPGHVNVKYAFMKHPTHRRLVCKDAGRSAMWKAKPSRITASSDSANVTNSGGATSRSVSVPESVNESIDQAKAGVRSAIAAGHSRILLQLLLPLIGPSLLDDWPGGIQQQYQAATPLVTSLLRGLGSGSQAGWSQRVLSEEDCAVLWETPEVLLVVFPTAGTLPAVWKAEAEEARARPLLLVNPQWRGGQVVSDFGFGSRKREAEAFLQQLVTAYSLRSTRMMSQSVTVVRCYPGDWQVYAAADGGPSSLVGTSQTEPSYREIEGMLKKGGSGDWLSRIASEIEFLKRSK